MTLPPRLTGRWDPGKVTYVPDPMPVFARILWVLWMAFWHVGVRAERPGPRSGHETFVCSQSDVRLPLDEVLSCAITELWLSC